ncbi:MAG: hypothetical protein GXP42_11560 [Chloroflexi bacterium]|nr:hypothetical protein [Chloroflexota bacterium]
MSRNTSITLLLAALLFSFSCFLATLCISTALIASRIDAGAAPAGGIREPLLLDIPTPEEPSLTPPLQTSTPEPVASPPPKSAPTPDLGSAPTPVGGEFSTEAQLRMVQVPSHDPRDAAVRLRPDVSEVPLVVNPTPPYYEEGDVITFWVSNVDSDENFQIDAVLAVKSQRLYMWVEQGANVDIEALRRSAAMFDDVIYPTNREFFGSEWSPGVDNDPRLHVLHAYNLGDTVAGYYSSADEVSSIVNPFSNEKEMFYINLDNNEPGSRFYNATLAHEFQHMIHWNQDLNETTWLNEGASELATQLTGLFRSDTGLLPDQVFAENPDLQLNTWPDSEDSYAHYGAAYLFMNYFLSRFGEEATKALVADPANGMESVDDVLRQFGYDFGADDLFGDWVIANWLDEPTLADGRWGYPEYDPAPMSVEERHRRLPAEGSGEVSQYAADYIRIKAEGDVQIEFVGQSTNKLAATDAYSGQWAWWSHRVDESDTRLTLPVDLSETDKATLRFKTWYDIEAFWDYAYVEISIDDGETWTILETNRTTRENPQGNAYGPGYTGVSGADAATWVQEEVDISDFAGQPALIRFEYITDAAVTQPGMFIDDIEIPEIGFFDDLESGPGQWRSEGWLLTNNLLQQRWLVQVIETRGDGSVAVHRLDVGADGRGSLRLENVSARHDLVLVVSALAPVTVEKAKYRYRVTAE